MADFDFLGLSPALQVSTIYVAYYGRAPGAAGIDFWVQQRAEALDDKAESQVLKHIAESFRQIVSLPADDPENTEGVSFALFREPSRADEAAVADFVNRVYENLFNRSAEGTIQDSGTGLGFWTQTLLDRLQAGEPIGDAIVDIASGAQGADAVTLRHKAEAALTFSEVFRGRSEAGFDVAANRAAAVNVIRNVDDTEQSLSAAAQAAETAADQVAATAGPVTQRLDELDGTRPAPARVNADEGAAVLGDEVGRSSFTTVSGFGPDDALVFRGEGNGEPVGADDVVVANLGDAIRLTVNADANRVSQVTLDGIDGPLGVDVAAFNALPVGNVGFAEGDDGSGGSGIDLDARGGTPQEPATVDAGERAAPLVDDVGRSSATRVQAFGGDDTLTFTGTVDGEPVGADDVVVEDLGDRVRATVNAGEDVVSAVTLLGVGGDLVGSVAAFNALDVGDITFG